MSEIQELLDGHVFPEDIQNKLEEAWDEVSNIPGAEAAVLFTKMSHDVFTSIITCVCVSHSRMRDVIEITNDVASKIVSFVSDEAVKVLSDPCADNLDKALFTIMLRTRQLAEDSLDVPRYDGTAKGS